MPIRLQARNKAPDFEVKDIFGKNISLYSKRGSLVLLSFYRQTTFPPCHFHFRVKQILKTRPGCQERLKFIAVFESEAEPIRKHIYPECNLPFSIIADPKANLFRLYKVDLPRWQTLIAMLRPQKTTHPSIPNYRQPINCAPNYTIDMLTKRLPADFLIMADGKIEIVHYGQNDCDYLPFSIIEHCLGNTK